MRRNQNLGYTDKKMKDIYFEESKSVGLTSPNQLVDVTSNPIFNPSNNSSALPEFLFYLVPEEKE